MRATPTDQPGRFLPLAEEGRRPSTPPVGRGVLGLARLRRARLGRAALTLACGLAALWPLGAAGAENGGLGPLATRSLFPPTLPFLVMQAEQTTPLPPSRWRVTYQYGVANIFINTQAPPHNSSTVITGANLGGGLTLANFPATGYRAYMDMELVRHQLAFRYGLSESVELGLDLAWVNFGGGGLDGSIEGIENLAGGLNQDRTYSPRNQFNYYVVHDGVFLHNTNQPGAGLAQDPVFSLKWGWTEGGTVWPAVSLKLAYKAPLEPNLDGRRLLVSSGHPDSGIYLLLSKQIGPIVAHYQFGQSTLGNPGIHYANQLTEQLFGVEFRRDEHNSWLFQMQTRSNLFQEDMRQTGGNDLFLARPTDAFVLGHKYHGGFFLFDLGLVEDFNQTQNETDIVFFTTLGWEW